MFSTITKVIGMPCSGCGKKDVPVMSLGDEWGYEYCSRCLLWLRNRVDDPEEEAEVVDDD